jgi:hypothetical protein
MHEIPQNFPEQNPNIYLAQLRKALDSRDEKLLRAVIDGIQISVHGTDKTHFSPLSDEDIRTLIETGEAMINVGTGTHGQRIMIRNGELYMPMPDPAIPRPAIIGEQVRENRMNFQRLFNLPDTSDLRVEF